MAVAIKNHGYTNIKIYNGGLKEWQESGLPIERMEPLLDYDVQFVTNQQLHDKLLPAEGNGCRTPNGRSLLTILDLRTERIPEGATVPVVIRTTCRTISGLLDDLLVERFRNRIPIDSPVYVVTETGNRDVFAARFLKRYGFSNIFGLQFGMRGWLKADYPTVQIDAQQ